MENSEYPASCPITDVKLVDVDKIGDFLANSLLFTYQRVSPPENLKIDWALYISKEYDAPPITGFQLETAPLCQGYRIGQPEEQLLDIARK